MEALAIEPRVRRTRTFTKPKTARDLGDEYFISLIEEGLKSEYVSEEEIMKILDE